METAYPLLFRGSVSVARSHDNPYEKWMTFTKRLSLAKHSQNCINRTRAHLLKRRGVTTLVRQDSARITVPISASATIFLKVNCTETHMLPYFIQTQIHLINIMKFSFADPPSGNSSLSLRFVPTTCTVFERSSLFSGP